MAKKQTRRSVSIRGTTYDRIRDFCERKGISMSEFVEARISTFFDGDAPAPAKSKALPKAPTPVPAKTLRAKPATAAPRQAKPANRRANGNGADEDALSFDELQNAARSFTF